MSERRKILREVIYLAHEGGYDGPGNDWDSASAAELDQVIASGAHLPVLRSEQFTRPFFMHILHPDPVTVTPDAVFEDVLEDELEEIEAEVAALGKKLADSDDPLEFLKQYLS
ncbi:MAG TPA: hypothetical protein VMJ70_08085 [Candidatus Sulfotelmatobacter sp.]|nr:hypothetical protein [Candidatus Sulfotelmatobacter sp.]